MASHHSDLQHLATQLESQVWRALIDGDPAADERLLADDFLGVYPTGFARRAEHVGQLDRGPSIASYSISGADVEELAPGQLRISYEATYARPNSARQHRMYVTSLWALRDGTWRNTFSQDTPASDA